MSKYPHPKIIPVKGRLRVCLEKINKNILKGKTLVDVGCSNGWLEYHLQDKKLKKIIAVDPNNDAIKFAKKYISNADYFVATAETLPVKDSIADLVTLFDVIEHVPKEKELDVLIEINRVLKKNGRLLLSTPNYNLFTNLLDPVWYLGHRHYTLDRISLLLKNSGFKVESLEVRGNIWFSLYLLWIYIGKRITGNPLPRISFLEEKDDHAFNNKGIHTIYAVAVKK